MSAPSTALRRPTPTPEASIVVVEPTSVPTVSASQVSYVTHWKRAAARLRRWLSPTTLRPSTVTSPGPRPAKHTAADQGVRRRAPSCQRAGGPAGVTAVTTSAPPPPRQWEGPPAPRAPNGTPARVGPPTPTP